MSEGFTNPINTSISTSGIEGLSLKELEKIWQDLTNSEMRLKMMEILKLHKVGFNDVENFNLGLVFNSKTLTYDNYTEKDDKKVVEAAMNFKRKDEIRLRRKLLREKIMARKKIDKEHGKRSNKERKLIKYLNERAELKRKELKESMRQTRTGSLTRCRRK